VEEGKDVNKHLFYNLRQDLGGGKKKSVHSLNALGCKKVVYQRGRETVATIPGIQYRDRTTSQIGCTQQQRRRACSVNGEPQKQGGSKGIREESGKSLTFKY